MTSFKEMNSRKRKEFREWLMAVQGERCHYCKCHIEILKPEQGQKIPSHMATFEHLVDDWDAESGKSDDIQDIVLACFECNTERGNVKQDLYITRLRATFPNKRAFQRFMTARKIGVFLIKDRLKKFEQASA